MNQMNNRGPGSTKDDLSSIVEAEEAQDELLQKFLETPVKERPKYFADTSTVANLVGRSSRTIELWISQGYIRAVRIGGKYEVLLQSVHDYLRQRALE